MSEEMQKKKPRGISKVSTNPGDNTKYLQHALAVTELEPIDINSTEEVAQRLEWYFRHCIENDMKPTVSGMANSLGVNRMTIYEWRTGKRRKKDKELQAVINRAYNILEELYEDYMMNGKINPVAGIYIGKNHFGYQDQQQVILSTADNADETASPEELQQKYIESVVTDKVEGSAVDLD